MFNQALQNAYDAGNWIHKCCATTHVLSHHYLYTAESIEQSCYCGSDAVQDNFDNFATSTPQKNSALLMPFNCMSFSPICKLPSVPIGSPQHRNESPTASTVQKSKEKILQHVITSSLVPKKPQAFKTNAA